MITLDDGPDSVEWEQEEPEPKNELENKVDRAMEDLINKIADLANGYKTLRDELDKHVTTPDAHHVAMMAKNKK